MIFNHFFLSSIKHELDALKICDEKNGHELDFAWTMSNVDPF